MKKTYIKGIDLDTIKIGDKLWFKEDSCNMEIGIVSKVEGTKVWANWKLEGNENSKAIEQFIDLNHQPEKEYCYAYGTIKEEEEMKTCQGNKHPQYEVIVHWANGGKIQYRSNIDEQWVDYLYGHDESPAWGYCQFRIKPKTKEIKYRVALMKGNTIKVFNEDIPIDDDCDFKQWLDPEWRYASVEV